MKGKAALLVGLATGYVLGTRDGRGRYEQLKTSAAKVMQDPRVQQKASQASDLAKDKAPVLKEKLATATSKATGRTTGRTTGNASSGSAGSGAPGTLADGAILVTTPSDPLAPATTSTDAQPGGLHG